MSSAGAGRWLAGIAVIAASAALAVLTGCAEDKDDTFDVSVSNITHRNVTTSSAYVAFDYSVQNAKPLEVGVVYSTLASKLNRKDIEAHKTSKNSNTAEFGVVSRGADQSWQFDADLINLADNKTYYYKPFVIIDKSDETRFVNGYYVPGTAEINEFTTQLDNLPKVAIGDPSGISRNSAIFTGTVVKRGTPAYTKRGFCYGTIKNPVKGNSAVQEVPASNDDVFLFTATGLTENETYYVSAYIENENGTVYSEQYKEFNTLARTLPTVTIDTVRGTSKTSATFNAAVGVIGDPPYTERGFCYGTTPNPRKGGGSTVVVDSGSTKAFTFTATGLTENTQYYVCAYIDNGVDATVYTAQEPFKTLASQPPKVILNSAAAATGTSATFTATIDTKGDPEYVERGFCYGEIPNPRKGNSTVTVDSGTADVFMLLASDLKNVTKYYVRAYVDNKVQEVQYSEEMEFTTPFTSDGKTYKVETFGDAIWMIEDFRGGGSINGSYTWSEAIENSPEGWVLPSDNDWKALDNVIGNKAKQYFISGAGYWSSTGYCGYFNYTSGYNNDRLRITQQSINYGCQSYHADSHYYVRYIKEK